MSDELNMRESSEESRGFTKEERKDIVNKIDKSYNVSKKKIPSFSFAMMWGTYRQIVDNNCELSKHENRAREIAYVTILQSDLSVSNEIEKNENSWLRRLGIKR